MYKLCFIFHIHRQRDKQFEMANDMMPIRLIPEIDFNQNHICFSSAKAHFYAIYHSERGSFGYLV